MSFIMDPTGVLGDNLTKSSSGSSVTDWNSISTAANKLVAELRSNLSTPQTTAPTTTNALAGQNTNYTSADLANAMTNNSATGWRNYLQAPHTTPTKWGI